MSKVEIKETIGCRKKLNIEVENERFDTELNSALKKMKGEVQIPGFRKGKAPESLLRNRFGNVIREEAVKDMIPKVLREVFEEQGIVPHAQTQEDIEVGLLLIQYLGLRDGIAHRLKLAD